MGMPKYLAESRDPRPEKSVSEEDRPSTDGSNMEWRTRTSRADREFSHQSYYRSLMRKMMVTILLVSITPLILISASILYNLEASYRAKALDYLRVLVKKHRNDIDNFLEERLADIKMLSTSYTQEELSDEDFLRKQLSKLHSTYPHVFVDLGVVDGNGVQRSYAGPFKLTDADYSGAPWFKDAIKKDFYISDVFMGLRGLPHFIVSVRTKSTGGTWILRATVDFESFNSRVQNIQIGATGFAFILNRAGEYQTKPRVHSGNVLEHAKQLIENADMESGQVHVLEPANGASIPTLYVFSALKGGDWLLVYRQKARDAFSVIYRARTIAALIFGIAAVCIVVVAIVMSRNMVRRVVESDAQKELMNEQIIHAGKLASIGELAAGIAHEINNPLAIMMEEAGWMEDLLEEEDLKNSENLGEYSRAINQIRKQGKRCKEITHKLLSFARRTDYEEQRVQLNEIIAEVINLSEQRAKYANVKIVAKLASELPDVSVSPSEIQQVLLNLINNSLDALASRGGIVEVSTSLTEDRIQIDLEDDGPGIPEANLSRIFDPFFTTKPVGSGTGLGLSICYGILKKMGGEITVNSAVGVGTIFHVSIPVQQEDAGEHQGAQLKQAAQTGN